MNDADAAGESVELINQAPVTRWYRLLGFFGGAVDLSAVLACIAITFGILMSGVSLLLPEIHRALTAIGLRTSDFLAFYVDLRALIGHNLTIIATVLPSVVIVLTRDAISVPYKSVAGLVVGLVFSAIGLGILLGLVVEGPWGMLKVIHWYLGVYDWVSGSVDYSRMTAGQVALTLGSYTVILSSLVYLGNTVIYFVFRSRLAGISRAFRPVDTLRFTAHLARTLIRSFISLNSMKVMALVLFAALMSGLLQEAVFVTLPLLLAPVFDPIRPFWAWIGNERFIFWFYAAYATFGAVLATLVIRRSLRSGLLLVVTALIVATYYFVVLIMPRDGPGIYFFTMAAFGALVAVIPLRAALFELRYIVHRAIVEARKSAGRHARQILFLRPFSLDEVLVRRRVRFFDLFIPLQPFKERLEEVVARTCYRHGPLIGVANPSEERLQLGAVREYLADDEWQPFVAERIKASRFIVFVLGAGTYTGWETNRIIESDALDKTIFVVPPERDNAHAYLEQNPKLFQSEHLRTTVLGLIAEKGVKCFRTDANGTVKLVIGGASTNLDYDTALDLALTQEAGAN